MRLWTALSALALILAVAACGDDDDDGATSAPESGQDESAEPGGDTEAFCSGVIDFNSAALATDLDDESTPAEVQAAGAELGPLWATMVDNAPDALTGAIGDLTPAIEALDEGDATAFNADEAFATYVGIVSGSVDACGFETTGVTGVDYGFDGVPATFAAGPTAFSFTNESDSEQHEMLVFRKAAGETRSAEEILNDPATEEPGEFVTVTFAGPGEQSSALADLTSGDYFMVCFLPVGGAEDGPPHFTQGMLTEFSVES
jgi:hypothetical protein